MKVNGDTGILSHTSQDIMKAELYGNAGNSADNTDTRLSTICPKKDTDSPQMDTAHYL